MDSARRGRAASRAGRARFRKPPRRPMARRYPPKVSRLMRGPRESRRPRPARPARSEFAVREARGAEGAARVEQGAELGVSLLDRQRIDKWLWHARVVRTRSAAALLAASGHVRLNSQRIDA